MKLLAPDVRLAALWEGGPRPFVEIAREGEAGIISPHYPLVTPQEVQVAHAAKLEVVPWTANTPQDWQEARQYWKARRGLRKGERQKRTCKSDL